MIRRPEVPVSLTCDPCLRAVHVRCRVLDCACSCRKTLFERRPERLQFTRDATTSCASRSHVTLDEGTRRRAIPAGVVAQAAEMHEAGMSWREVGAELGWDYSGLRRAVLAEAKRKGGAW